MDFEGRIEAERARREAVEAQEAAEAEKLEAQRRRLRDSLQEVEVAVAALRKDQARSQSFLSTAAPDSYLPKTSEIVLALGDDSGHLILREASAQPPRLGFGHPSRKLLLRRWKERRHRWEHRHPIGWLVSASAVGSGHARYQFHVPFETGPVSWFADGSGGEEQPHLRSLDELAERVEWAEGMTAHPESPTIHYSAAMMIRAFLEIVASHRVDLDDT